METTIKTIALVITATLFSTVSAFASSENSSYITEIAHNEIVRQSINSTLSYPAQAKAEKKEGFVLVSFKYTEDGGVQVLEMNTNDSVFGNYVREKLSSIPTCPNAKQTGNTYQMRFNFKLM